jgi:hypothetical protein
VRTRVERLELGQRLLADHALAVRRPIQDRIVDDDDFAVSRQVDVDLDGVDAQRDRPLERGERVLRRVAHGAAVPEDARTTARSMLPHQITLSASG